MSLLFRKKLFNGFLEISSRTINEKIKFARLYYLTTVNSLYCYIFVVN